MEYRYSKTAAVNRRRFLRVGALAGAGVLAAACAPSATPAPVAQVAAPAGPATQAAWELEWEKLVAAAWWTPSSR